MARKPTKVPAKTPRRKAKAAETPVEPRVVSATMVAVTNPNAPLGEAVSEAMIQAIKDCHAEGQTAPERIRERMQEARQRVIDEHDRQVKEAEDKLRNG